MTSDYCAWTRPYAIASNQTNQNGLHSKTQCCGGLHEANPALPCLDRVVLAEGGALGASPFLCLAVLDV